MAVLAAREADHHAVAVLDQVEIGDCLADLAPQRLGELGLLVFRFAQLGHFGSLALAGCAFAKYNRTEAQYPFWLQELADSGYIKTERPRPTAMIRPVT